MIALINVLQLLFATLISVLIIRLIKPFLQKFFLDKPVERSSHLIAKPSAGGISFVIVGTLFFVIKGNIYPLLCLPLAIVGFLDDFIKLNRTIRFIIQFFTIILLISNSQLFNNLFAENINFLSIVFTFLSIFFFLAVINFINFMDGLDGLVAGSMVVILFTACVLISNTYYPLLGALLGFLWFNWNPSKVFMGDGGSTYLGGIFVGLILLSKDWIVATKFILVASPILADAFICVIRRFLNKESIFEAHRSHLYQRLNQAGWSHGSVSTLYVIFTSILSITVIFFNIKLTVLFMFFELCAVIWLDQKVSVPFLNSISTDKTL